MTAVALERVDSQSGEMGLAGTAELIFTVTGTADFSDAYSALVDEAPTEFDDPDVRKGLVPKTYSLVPVCIDEDANYGYGDGKWTGTVKYAAPENIRTKPKTGDRVITFDTSGGTQHITQSISTAHKYAPLGKTAPDFKGAISVTHDSVEGCDVVVPTFKFSVTAYIADEDVTPTYIGKLYALTGKINNAEFTVLGFGAFQAGELLFLGSAATQRGDGSDWEVQWHFAASPNKTGITIGDIQNVEKKGWEYLWVRYEDTDDTTAKSIVKRPTAVYVEKVYDEGDFGDLEPQEPEA
jgi:hypothetical protein